LQLEIAPAGSATTTTMPDPGMEALRLANPMGRAMPLLTAIARHESRGVMLGLNAENSLRIHVDAAR